MVGRIPGPYAEALVRPGDVIPAADAYYEHVGGRFRFRGSASAEIEAAVVATAAGFRVAGEPVLEDTTETAGHNPDAQTADPARGKDYSVPVLAGPGESDYARYMRTDTLLSLQRLPADVVHRDELLFQIVHQSTELWLKHACFEVAGAAEQVRAGVPTAAARLLDRAALGVALITDQLEMLRYLSPWDFQTIRTVLGHGSGFESPGWRGVRKVSQEIGRAFDDLIGERGLDLVQLYKDGPDHPLYRLAEAMVEWDERVAVWRVRHYKVATRIIGHDVIGTKGTPVDVLAGLISHKFFPRLWQARTELTRHGPMGEALDAVVAAR
jgi:tryptophan 2,3-dioxygenase